MKEYSIKINGNDYMVVVGDTEEGVAHIQVNGVEYSVEVEDIASNSTAPHPANTAASEPSTASTPTKSTGGASIKSPLPGVIIDVNVREGDRVKVGQKLMVLEAMKMENNIDSNVEGTVKSVVKQKGDSVMEGDVLVVFE